MHHFEKVEIRGAGGQNGRLDAYFLTSGDGIASQSKSDTVWANV